MRRKTLTEFILEAKAVHGDLYDYSNVNYISTQKKVEISCKIHGKFLQKPGNHINLKNGCPKCGTKRAHDAAKLSQEEAILKINQNSSSKWTFEKFKYDGAHTKATITCIVHGDKEVKPNDLFHGRGCSDCAKSGFNFKGPAILYYLKVTCPKTGIKAYKLGITNNTVQRRYSKSELEKIEVLGILKFQEGQNCRDVEQQLLKHKQLYKYNGINLLKAGNSELFSIDILPNFRTKENHEYVKG